MTPLHDLRLALEASAKTSGRAAELAAMLKALDEIELRHAPTLPCPVWSAAFEIPRKPRGKARHRMVPLMRGGRAVLDRTGRPILRSFVDPDAQMDEDAVAVLAARYAPERPHEGPVVFRQVDRLLVAKSWSPWEREAALAGALFPTGTPDADNLLKRVLDALTSSGRWWRDDAQIIRVEQAKVYADTPGTRVEVYFLPEVTREDWKAKQAAAKAAKAAKAADVGGDLFAGVGKERG